MVSPQCLLEAHHAARSRPSVAGAAAAGDLRLGWMFDRPSLGERAPGVEAAEAAAAHWCLAMPA